MKKSVKIGICQIKTTENKLENIKTAWKSAQEVHSKGAQVVLFGEMFTCPYMKEMFKDYSENFNLISKQIPENFQQAVESSTPTLDFLRFSSKSLDSLIVGGSIPELEGNKLYNTCFVFDKGELVGFHRKAHLFDIDIPGKISFKESEVLAPGDKLTVIKTRFFNLGLGICYDIRFAEYAMSLRELGAEVLVYPSVFNFVTGPKHFLLSGQARALDTQCYVITSSNATYKDRKDLFQCYGHSYCIDCEGKVITQLGEDEEVGVFDIDLGHIEEFRRNLPYTSYQKRRDLYGKS